MYHDTKPNDNHFVLALVLLLDYIEFLECQRAVQYFLAYEKPWLAVISQSRKQ